MLLDVASYKHAVAAWRTSHIPTAVLKEVRDKTLRKRLTEIKDPLPEWFERVV